MITRTILCVSLTLAVAVLNAQQPQLSGSVKDTGENRLLENAVISLISTKDSTLVSFVRSRSDGSFSFSKVPAGTYTMMVSYPKFADYIETISLVEGKPITAHTIPLTPLSQLLEEVVISRQSGAMRMRGDTLAYLADSFALKDGATVEDLLKRLPGIQVDKSGNITAQGEKVSKVLLDGEEFFSDDPAVVTQNLGADAIKEVQVFDKKSEQAEFTGIDDGKTQKTINLKLKPERKKGYFGKASLAGGTKGAFDNDAMINAFKGDRKISVYGIMSNTGRNSLGWEDREKFGDQDISYDEDEGYFFVNSDNEDFEWNQGQGLPTTWTGGVHYSNKMRDGKDKINLNYRLFKMNTRANSENISQFILADTQYFNNTTTKSFDSKFMNKLNGRYEWQLDSLSSIKLSVRGGTLEDDLNTLTTNTALDEGHQLVNENARTMSSHSYKKQLGTSLLWRQKFRKKGRTLSLSLIQDYENIDQQRLLQSRTDYYHLNAIDSTELIDQRKEHSSESNDLRANIVYTEPLHKNLTLALNLGYHTNDSKSKINSLNKGEGSGNYDEMDPLFSNNFKYKYDISSGGLTLKFNRKKLTLTAGASGNYASYDQLDLFRDTASRYNFLNFFPRAQLKYLFSPQSRFSMEYRGETIPPNLRQLQPIRENTDPLNIVIGNPGLRQEFRNSFNLHFNNYKVLSERYFGIHVNYSMSDRAISTSDLVQPGGKRIIQAVNVDGNQEMSLYSYFSRRLPKSKWSAGFDFNLNYSLTNNFVNLVKNRNKYSRVNLSINQRTDVKDKFTIQFREGASYFITRSSINPDEVTEYFTYQVQFNGTLKLPWKLNAETWVVADFREKTTAFDRNRNAINWNINLSRKFFKGDKGELRLEVYDLLNQNIGFDRTTSSNFISENTYNTFTRYGMLRFIYRFTKTPAAAPAN